MGDGENTKSRTAKIAALHYFYLYFPVGGTAPSNVTLASLLSWVQLAARTVD